MCCCTKIEGTLNSNDFKSFRNKHGCAAPLILDLMLNWPVLDLK